MKKTLLLISFALVLLAGVLLTINLRPQDGKVCQTENSQHLVWGQVAYVLPECWMASEKTVGVLTIQSELTPSVVIFQKTAPDLLTAGTQTFGLSTGQTLYAIPNSETDEDSENILDSIKILSFSVAPSDCAAPDYDYAQSIIYTWQGITFGLPYCWGAEESHTLRGDPQLALYKSQDDSTYLRVNFWHDDPITKRYEKLEDTTVAGYPAEHYFYPLMEGTNDNSHIYKLESDPIWYIETGNPEVYEIQSLLSSITIEPVTFPDDQ